jgi:hypothetical protein
MRFLSSEKFLPYKKDRYGLKRKERKKRKKRPIHYQG